MSGWNSAIQSAGQHVQNLHNQVQNVAPPPPPNMSGWHSTLQGVGQSMQQLGGRIQQTGQTMQNAFAPAAAASSMFLGSMIKDAMNFESETRKAAMLTGGSYNQVKKDILDMASTSVYSTGEVAHAFAELGAKGFDAAKATEALPGILLAAAASSEDLGLVADTVTSALNAFGMEASKSGHVADVLAQAANQSAAGVLDMQYAFKYAAGPANALGISMEELAASIGIMTDAGATGETAGTTLRSVLLTLAKSAKEPPKELKKLGISVTDQDGKMKSLSKIIEEVKNGMNGYSDAQRAAALSSIFGTEAVTGVLNLMEAGPDKINKMTDALVHSDGAAAEAAKKMNEGWAGAIREMSSAVDTASKVFVDSLGPAITFIANAVRDLANWFTHLSKPMQSVVATTAAFTTAFLIIGTVLGIMINAIGGAILMLGTFVGWLAKTGIVARVASVGMMLLNGAIALLTSPIGIVVAALAAIGIALVQLYKHNATFANAVNSTWGVIKTKVTEVSKAFMEFAGPAISAAIAGFNRLKSAIVAVFHGDFSQLGEIFKMIGPSIAGAIVGGIPGVLISISRFLPAIAGYLNSNKGVILQAITNVFNSVAGFLTSTLPKLIEAGSQIVSNLVQGLVVAAPSILSAMVGVINSVMQSIATNLPVLISAGVQIITTIVQGITQLLPTILQTGLQLLLTLIQGILQMIPQLIPVVVSIIQTIITGLMSFLPQLIEIGINLLVTLITGITQALPMIALAIITVITTLIEAITANLPMIIQAGISILTTLINGIIQMLPMLIDLAINLIMKISETILANLPMLLDAGIKILMALIDGIVQILPQLINAALDLIFKIVDTLIANLPKIIDAGVKILMALIAGIVKIIPELVVAAVKLIVTLVTELIKNLPKLLEAGVKLIEALIKGILSLLGSLGSAALEIGGKLIDTLREVNLLDVGKNIMKGLLDGISSMASSIWSKVTEIGDGIKDKLTGLFKIHSPSRWMRDMIGVNMMQGWINGIDGMKSAVLRTSQNIAEWMKPEMLAVDSGYGISGGALAGNVRVANTNKPKGNDNGTQTVNFERMFDGANFYVRNDNDIKGVARELHGLTEAEKRRRGIR